jgi:hypothetical protein
MSVSLLCNEPFDADDSLKFQINEYAIKHTIQVIIILVFIIANILINVITFYDKNHKRFGKIIKLQ